MARGGGGAGASEAIIHLVGLNGWPPSADTKEWSQPNRRAAPPKNGGHQERLVAVDVTSMDKKSWSE